MPKKLSPKQKLFAEEYLVDRNATKAAIRAGYSKASAYSTAHDLLKKPEIQTIIENHNAARSKRTKITADRVLRELASVAFADLTDFITQGREGLDLATLAALPRAQRCSLLEVSESWGPRGPRRKVKLHSKLHALELLGRHLGMWKGNEDGDTNETWELIVKDYTRPDEK